MIGGYASFVFKSTVSEQIVDVVYRMRCIRCSCDKIETLYFLLSKSRAFLLVFNVYVVDFFTANPSSVLVFLFFHLYTETKFIGRFFPFSKVGCAIVASGATCKVLVCRKSEPAISHAFHMFYRNQCVTVYYNVVLRK